MKELGQDSRFSNKEPNRATPHPQKLELVVCLLYSVKK